MSTSPGGDESILGDLIMNPRDITCIPVQICWHWCISRQSSLTTPECISRCMPHIGRSHICIIWLKSVADVEWYTMHYSPIKWQHTTLYKDFPDCTHSKCPLIIHSNPFFSFLLLKFCQGLNFNFKEKIFIFLVLHWFVKVSAK